MLGRLRMSVDECIDEYEQLSKEVFGDQRGPFKKFMYDHARLENVIKRVLREQLGKNVSNNDLGSEKLKELENAPLLDESCCKT